MPIANDTENTLIDRIYEAAVVFEGWPETLRQTAQAVDCKDGVLATALGDQVRFVTSTEYYEQALHEMLERYPLSVNERTVRLLAARYEGFLVDQDVFSSDEIAREPVYQEILIPQGYGAGVATAIPVPSGDTVIVHCERAIAKGPVTSSSVALLDRLRPHFARAGLLSSRLALEKARAAAEALEMMGLPGAVLGPRGRILSANSLLTDMMPGVFRDRPARLAIVNEAADHLLELAVADASLNQHAAAVRSIPIPAGENQPPIVVHLTPVKGRARDVFASAVAILIATPVVPRQVEGVGVIQGLFDLTPAEARLAALIATGYTPREASIRLGVREGTARTTLKRVLEKTGTRRQSQLVGLLQSTAKPG